LFLLFLVPGVVLAQIVNPVPFVETPWSPDAAKQTWLAADIDNDNDYDLASLGPGSRFQSNDGSGTFTGGAFLSPTLASDNVHAVDIDNDGDIDFCGLVGDLYSWRRVTVMVNNGGTYSKQFESQEYSNVNIYSLEDLNHDGRPDILFSHTDWQYRLFYQTAAGDFVDSGVRFDPQGDFAYAGEYVVADIDGDGFKDIVQAGNTSSFDPRPAKFFKNLKGRGFEAISTNLPVLLYPRFTDWNGDGKVDLIRMTDNGISISYGQGNFTFGTAQEIPLGVNTVRRIIDIADVDLNGWPDLVVNDGFRLKMVLNSGNGISTIATNTFVSGLDSDFITIDVEGDGDIDVIRTSEAAGHQQYRNQITTVRTVSPPSTPSNLLASKASGELTLSWSASLDDATPSALIHYNIWLEDDMGKSWIHPITNAAGTFRRVLKPGNAGYRISITVNDLPPGDYTVRVQALDAGYALSAWSTDLLFTIDQGPANFTAQRLLLNKVQLNWDDMPGELGYVVERMSLTTGVATIANLPANATEFIDDELPLNNSYTYRVLATVGGQLLASSETAQHSTMLFVAQQSTTLPNGRGNYDAGDFNRDGRMDLLILSSRIFNGTTVNQTSTFYENTPGGWVPQAVGTPSGALPPYSSMRFFDFNNDHKLDIVKHYFNAGFLTEAYVNNGNNTFSPVTNLFTTMAYDIRSTWDYEMDNDLDIFVEEFQGNGSHFLLKKEGSTLTSVPSTSFGCGCQLQSLAGDFDGDGDEDVIRQDPPFGGTYLHIATPKGLIKTEEFFEPNILQAIDYNGDGLLDVFSISKDYVYDSKLYKNVGPDESGIPQFTVVKNDFSDGAGLGATWADYDHDGDLDLFFPYTNSAVYLNAGNDTFIPYWMHDFPLDHATAINIDIDADGDLDIFVPGYEVNGVDHPYPTILYNQVIINGGGNENDPPSSPTNLSVEQDTTGIHLRWDVPTDDHTLGSALTYDVVLFEDGVEYSSGAFGLDGSRSTLQRGRSQNTLVLHKFKLDKTYTWNVQAVDQTYRGSALSLDGPAFTAVPPPPAVSDTTLIQCGSAVPSVKAVGQNVKWYADKQGTQLIAEGMFYVPEYSEIVFVRQTINGVPGIMKSVAITVRDCNGYLIVGVEESLDNQVKVYPNPARESFVIQVSESFRAQIRIHDVHGRLVSTPALTLGQTTVSTSNFSKGLFVIEVTLSNGTTVRRKVLVN